MSVNTTSSKVIYTGDGVSSTFSFAFPAYLNTDLVVSVKTIATGTITTLALTTDYTVAFTLSTTPSPGSVTLLGAYIALSNAYQIIIQRVLPLTQLIALVNNEKTSALMLSMMMRIQQILGE